MTTATSSRLEQQLSDYQRRILAKQLSSKFSASSVGLGKVSNWSPVAHHERPAAMQMRPASVCWSKSMATREGAAQMGHRRPTTGDSPNSKIQRHNSLSPMRHRGGPRTPEQRGHLRARKSGSLYTVKSLGQLSEGSCRGWKNSSSYARLNSDITDPSKSTASPSYNRSGMQKDCPPRTSVRKAVGQLSSTNSRPPLQSRPLHPGNACQVYVRSKNAFVPAVVLELTIDDDGNDMAHVQHCLMLGGIMDVYTNRPTEFRPSASPHVLTYQLSQCWQRWQETQSNADVSPQKRLFTSDQSTAPSGWIQQSYSLPEVHSQIAQSARDRAGLVGDQVRELATRVACKTYNPANSSMRRGSNIQSGTAAAAASAQSAVGIGQSTVSGIKRYIITKVEQNSINIRPVFRKFDDDKSGLLNYDEFRRGLLHMGIPLNDGEFALLCKEVDNDGNGEIDYTEFVEDMKDNDQDQSSFQDHQSSSSHGGKTPQPAAAAAAASAQSAVGIGQSTVSGIKRYIITKVEQNSINIRPVFRKFDDDKSGLLNYDEFRRGLLHMGIPLNDGEFALLCKEVDNDGNGEIDYAEFVEDMKDNDQDQSSFQDHQSSSSHGGKTPQPAAAAAAASAQSAVGIGQSTVSGIKRYIITKVEQNSINIRPVFRKFDDDKSGLLNYDEFRRGLLHMGIPLNDGEFALLCKEVDNDGNGEIDYTEFVEDMKDNDQDQSSFQDHQSQHHQSSLA